MESPPFSDFMIADRTVAFKQEGLEFPQPLVANPVFQKKLFCFTEKKC